MEEALLRILTPRRSIDILRDVQSAKERARPYVIVFVGVNGVGKSTNLAKVCFSVHHMFMIKKNPSLDWTLTHFHMLSKLHRSLIGFFSITSVSHSQHVTPSDLVLLSSFALMLAGFR
jgi:hypothetical protein